MSQSFNLYQLQKIDSRIDQLIHRVNEISLLLDDNSAINEIDAELKETERKRDNLYQEISDLDDEIGRKKIKVNQSESSLYGGKVQSPKELQSLQAEISSINKNISEKESTLVELMQLFEKAEAEIESTKNSLDKANVDKKERDHQLLLEKQTLENEKSKLESERCVAISQVKPEYLEKYEEIRKKRKNIAVTSVEEDTCSACGVSLTPSEWQSARSSDKICFCPSCSRILYAG